MKSVSWVISLTVFLAGCVKPQLGYVDSQQVKFEPQKIHQIRIGQTTRTEAESLLGRPMSVKENRGQTELNYYWSASDSGYTIDKNPTVKNGIGVVWSKTYHEQHDSQIARILIDSNDKVTGFKCFVFVMSDLKADFSNMEQIVPGVTTQQEVERWFSVPAESAYIENNTCEWKSWPYNVKPFNYLSVVFDSRGVVEEVSKCYEDAAWFSKKVAERKLAGIKERQSTRGQAESVLGRPSTLSRTVQGKFSTYFIRVSNQQEEVYIQYDDRDVIACMMRKPFKGMNEF